jgi:hypothetical protein
MHLKLENQAGASFDFIGYLFEFLNFTDVFNDKGNGNDRNIVHGVWGVSPTAGVVLHAKCKILAGPAFGQDFLEMGNTHF